MTIGATLMGTCVQHAATITTCGKMLQPMANRGNMRALDQTYGGVVGDLRPFCEIPVCPSD